MMMKYIENEDFKIPGNWERFIKRFQEKFWKEFNTTSEPVKNEENKLIAKPEIWN
jgi:hypothetical protein